MYVFSNIQYDTSPMNILIYAKMITEPFIKNWLLGKLAVFVSEIINMSTSPLTFRMRASNLFLFELKFKCAATSLFKFVLRIAFKWLISFITFRFIFCTFIESRFRLRGNWDITQSRDLTIILGLSNHVLFLGLPPIP